MSDQCQVINCKICERPFQSCNGNQICNGCIVKQNLPGAYSAGEKLAQLVEDQIIKGITK